MAASRAGDVVARAFRVQNRKIDWLFVIRCSAGMAIALVASYATHAPLAGVVGGFTALGVGTASQQGVYRTRLVTMAATTIGMTLCTTIGFLTVGNPPLSILMLAVFGYIYGLTASFGPATSAIGIWAILALIVFNHFGATPMQIKLFALVSLESGALQMVLLVLTWPLYRYAEERHALATAYRGLAQYARGTGAPEDLVRQSLSLQRIQHVLADPQPFGRPLAMTAFQTLLNEAERVRGTLALLPPRDTTFAKDRRVAASALDEIADAIDASRPPLNDALLSQLGAPVSNPTVRALFGQLRAAWRWTSPCLADVALQPRRMRARAAAADLGQLWSLIRHNMALDTSYGRHALRFAVVMAVARGMEHVMPFPRAYWITFTAAVVLKPDFATTFVTAIGRIAGTIVGVVVSTIIVVAAKNTPVTDLVLAALFAVMTFATTQYNTTLNSLFITGYVIFILASAGQPEHEAIVNRAIASVAGGLLGMVAYAVWPTWESPAIRQRFETLFRAFRAYLLGLFDALADPIARKSSQLDELRNATWRARADADESLERMLNEPREPRELPDAQALGVMAAAYRLEFACLELWSLCRNDSTPALPQVLPFSKALDDALGGVLAGLSTGVSDVQRRALRDAYDAMRDTLPRRGEAWCGALLDAGDRLVDSTNTVAELLLILRSRFTPGA